MEINQNILTTSNLTFDINPSLSEVKDIFYALNLEFSSHSNSEFNYYIQNTASNELCVDFGKDILGAIKLNDDNFVVFIENEMFLFDSKNCVKISLVVDKCLNFGTEVKGVYKYNQTGRTIYFIDDKNPLRYFNVDKVYPKKKIERDCNTCKDEYTNCLDCDDLLVWKNVKYPKLKFKKGNGRLPSGKYQIAISFTNNKLRLTDYFIYPNIFTVAPYEKSSLNIEFECFNDYFEEYELVLIAHREDRGAIAQRVAYLDTSHTSFAINEADAASYAPIDTKILFAKKPYYQGFEHISLNGTTTEGQLVLGGLKERNPINYWKQAFNVKGEWVEVKVPKEEVYKLPSFLRDEQYSLEIGWLFKDGQISNRTHLPSVVVMKPLWNTMPNNDDTWTDCNNKDRKYWEIYNTAESIGCKLVTKTKQIEVCDYTLGVANGTVNLVYSQVVNGVIQETSITTSLNVTATAIKDKFNVYGFWEDASFDITFGNCRFVTVTYQENQCVQEEFIGDIELCNFKVVNRGKFAYWESQLQYPDHENFITDKGDFRCKGIKHWKFPDNKISNHHSIDENGKEYAHLLTIQLSNIEKPKDCNGKYIEDITGYIIYVTDRQNHKTVLHKGLVSNMWEEDLKDCSKSYYNNYPFNDLNPDVFLSKTLTHGDVRNSYKPVTQYSKNRFTYLSPDVDYIRNTTGEEIRIYSEENGFVKGSYNATNEFPEIKYLNDDFYRTLGLLTISTYTLQLLASAQALGIGFNGGGGTSSIPVLVDAYYSLLKGFLPYDNYGINYYTHGNYTTSNFNNVVEGNLRRKLNFSNYLLPIKQIQNEDKVNNYQREQGLYIKLNKDIKDPFNKEYSRVRTKDSSCADFDKNYVFNPATNQNERATCSSYYVGLKVYKPTQYGNLNNSVAISKYFTNDIKTFNETPLIFGGDVYITKHKKLRKFPFFTALPPDGYNDVGIIQSKSFNIWKPRFYMDFSLKNPIFESLKNLPGIGGIFDVFDKSPFNFEYGNDKEITHCNDTLICVRPSSGDGGDGIQLKGRTFRQNGSIYTHAIGIQEYWCESEFVSDYREFSEIPESNLNVDETSLIKYNRIQNPELSLYNLQYLWNGILSNSVNANSKLSCCCDINTDQSRIIFSQANNIESQGDKWLSYLPLNYHQFTNTYGKMIGIHKVNDGNIMFIFEDATFVTQNNAGILTDKGIAYAGEGSIFTRNMIKLPGSIDYLSFVNTPYGVYWCNRKLKEFYFYDSQLNNITDGIRSWSYEFLNSEVKGIYDPYTENVFWSSNTWTITFKPKAKTWVSFHSFLPKRYLETSNNILTYQTSSIWKHNAKYDYQSFYGTKYPFIVGFTVNNKFELRSLHSLEIYADFIKEHDYNSKEYTDEFFNKIAVFSQKTSTGLQDIYSNKLDIKDKPKFTRLNEGKYRINGFRNRASGQPLTEFKDMEYTFVNTNKAVEGNIIGFTNRVLLQSEHNLKVLLKLNLSVEQQVIK